MKKKTVVIIVMCIAILIMAIGYAAFQTKLNINTTGNITTTWNIYFSNISSELTGGAVNLVTPSVTSTTAHFEAELELPGDKIAYTITLKNGGNIDAIISNIDINSTGPYQIINRISDIKIGDKLARGAETTFKLTTEFDPNATYIPEDAISTIDLTMDVVQDTGQTITENTPIINTQKLNAAILSNNNAQSDVSIDFSQISSDTNGKGLYYTNDNTEDGKTTYYFRGAVKNNYVSFVGFTWRIVRINEDGSIRLIKEDSVGQSAFNCNIDDNAYVGYMYGTAGSSTYALTHTNTNNSTIKDVVDTWYQNNLASYSNYLAAAGFCNDRSIASTAGSWNSSDKALGYGTNTTYYGAYNRLVNLKKPQFVCPKSNDLFTTSSSIKGNKALTNPIGLITVDEVIYAGGKSGTTNRNYYLANGDDFWTMSPYGSDGIDAYGWRVSVDGSVSYGSVNDAWDVRPVINLKSTVEISGGTGTSTTPYVIK